MKNFIFEQQHLTCIGNQQKTEGTLAQLPIFFCKADTVLQSWIWTGGTLNTTSVSDTVNSFFGKVTIFSDFLSRMSLEITMALLPVADQKTCTIKTEKASKY